MKSEKVSMSKTYIKLRTKRKTNPILAETINLARKNSAWTSVAKILSGSTRKQSTFNLSDINEHAKEGDTVVILGRVLSVGELTKKLRICALGFSAQAEIKIKKNKSEMVLLKEEIQNNPKGEGIKLLQ